MSLEWLRGWKRATCTSLGFSGRHHSLEAKARMSASRTGKPRSERTKARISAGLLKGRLRKRFRVSKEEFSELNLNQSGKCAVCSEVPSLKSYKIKGKTVVRRGLVVDHDHATGRRRALLCLSCNRTVVGLLESPRGQKGLEYIKAWKKRGEAKINLRVFQKRERVEE